MLPFKGAFCLFSQYKDEHKKKENKTKKEPVAAYLSCPSVGGEKKEGEIWFFVCFCFVERRKYRI